MKNIIEIRKSGKFYNSFGEDAIILHNILGYKIVREKGGTGFPETAYNKVINTLESHEVSYKVYEKDNIIAEHDFKKINKYSKLLNEGIKSLSLEERIDKIYQKIKSLNKKELENLLRIIEDAI